tara:strand:- start:968 stop:1075 length:108 start_codon:yes stop_codon:yes gene_type:complete
MKDIKQIQTELKGVRQRIKERADKIVQKKALKQAS